MTYRGQVKGGAIVLEPGVDLPEGSIVRIELETSERSRREEPADPLFRMTELAVDTGIRDLSTNIDHYLYGHPKASDAG
jgi:hypothetical protein